jgi:hypothetical protein
LLINIVESPHQLHKGLRVCKRKCVVQGAALELIGAVQQHPTVDVGVAAQRLHAAHDHPVAAAPQAEDQSAIRGLRGDVAFDFTKAWQRKLLEHLGTSRFRGALPGSPSCPRNPAEESP